MLEPVGIECWRLGLGRDDARSDVQENPLEYSSSSLGLRPTRWVGASCTAAMLGLDAGAVGVE